MDTRALRNPYPDYDGSPASIQALFDCQGKVMREACVTTFVYVLVFHVTLHYFDLSLYSAHIRVCTATELQG